MKMKYKPENVELVITHNGVEQEVVEFDESTLTKDSQPKKTKSKRCKDTIDLVEVEYGDAYEKPNVNKKQKKSLQGCNQSLQGCNQSLQGCNQSISSTLVKQLTKSEIESLRQNKRDAYEIMMKMN